MSSSLSAAQQRAATRKALARKAAARKKTVVTKASIKETTVGSGSTPGKSTGPVSGANGATLAAGLPPATAAAAKPGFASGSTSTPQRVRPGDGGATATPASSRSRRRLTPSRADGPVGTTSTAAATGSGVVRRGVDGRSAAGSGISPGTDSRLSSMAARSRTRGTRGWKQLADGLPRPRVGGRRFGRTRRDHKGGVAPFVPPSSRAGRELRLRRWERRGFVPLSPGRAKLRHRILPRTVIGISFTLLAFAAGSAFSGAAFYAYYDNRLAENEQAVALFVDGFDQQFTDAAGALDELRATAIDDIRDELEPLGDVVEDAHGVIGLPVVAGPSVWLLETRDETGKPLAGAAFAVAPHDGGTVFVTSYNLVTASTTTPSPAIELVKDGRRVPSQLWAWDVERDLAVLVVDEEVPHLVLATDEDQIRAVGGRIFAMSGVGGQGTTASPGVLLDRSDRGLQHTAPIGALYRGGPLLTGDGRVLGVASLDYRPYGYEPGAVAQAPGVLDLCAVVLACADNDTDVDLAADEADAPPTGTAADDADSGVEADEIDPDAEG